jgi:7-cyano-7-deazaguanine reductase
MSENLLGKPADVPERYAPELLFGVSRRDAREAILPGPDLPFHGEDIWNAWELTWLAPSGKPVAATATIRVPADSERIIESKSLKLYLTSLANMRYKSAAAVTEIIADDLGAITGAPVAIDIVPLHDGATDVVRQFPGDCIDDVEGEFSATDDGPDPELLESGSETVSEVLHSHLLRSLCPVTGQPDTGSVLIRYEGPRLQRLALLQYLVSYRRHQAFHEACVEKIFVDLKERCGPRRLSVYARYNRRGGLDINPFRSDFEPGVDNLRLWRQ